MSFVAKSTTFLALAFPMIISNIFVPLAGLVDTAIVGHLPGEHYLAGVALGGVILTQVIWVCGFLRMSTTGLSAQGKGKNDVRMLSDTLRNGAVLAIFIGASLMLLQTPLFQLALHLSATDNDVETVAASYFSIRINFIIVPLLNLVFSGWMLGQQWHKKVMYIQILASISNLILSYLLAFEFGFGVSGVAIATVTSEILVMVMSFSIIAKQHPVVIQKLRQSSLFKCHRKTEFMALLSLNRDMFLRNLTLQLCLAMITFAGLRLGGMTAATNAILMQFFVLIALGLDGIAYAVEALIGEAVGRESIKDIEKKSKMLKQAFLAQKSSLRDWVNISLVWSNLFALAYSVLFFVGFGSIAQLMTNIGSLQANMQLYKWYIVTLPLVAHWCFTFDGIYIGLMRADIMRNAMMLSAFLAFCPMLLFLNDVDNHMIWQSFLGFLLLRGLTLLFHYLYCIKEEPGSATSG